MILKSFVSHGKLIVPSLLFWTQIQIKPWVVFFSQCIGLTSLLENNFILVSEKGHGDFLL
jgi:hypothetical protein